MLSSLKPNPRKTNSNHCTILNSQGSIISPFTHSPQDLNKNLCPKTGAPCTNPGDDPKRPLCSKSPKNKVQDSNGVSPTSLAIELEESRWYRPLTLKNLGEILQQHKTHTVKMVFGNTAAGKNQRDLLVCLVS